MPSFQNWKRRLAAETAGRNADEFVELPLVPPARSPGWDIDLDLGAGLCLRLRRS